MSYSGSSLIKEIPTQLILKMILPQNSVSLFMNLVSYYLYKFMLVYNVLIHSKLNLLYTLFVAHITLDLWGRDDLCGRLTDSLSSSPSPSLLSSSSSSSSELESG
jgi:hypothetical protein